MILAKDVVSSDVLKITPFARPQCRHSALRTNQIVIFFMTSCVLLDADFYHFWCLNTSPAWGRYVSTNRMMQYGWWSLRHFLLTCEIVIYWIRFYHFVLLCIVFVVLKYNEGETLILLLYIHRIFYLFIVIFYRKFIENTCDKITVVSLALYMYIAYYLSPAVFLSRF